MFAFHRFPSSTPTSGTDPVRALTTLHAHSLDGSQARAPFLAAAALMSTSNVVEVVRLVVDTRRPTWPIHPHPNKDRLSIRSSIGANTVLSRSIGYLPTVSDRSLNDPYAVFYCLPNIHPFRFVVGRSVPIVPFHAPVRTRRNLPIHLVKSYRWLSSIAKA